MAPKIKSIMLVTFLIVLDIFLPLTFMPTLYSDKLPAVKEEIKKNNSAGEGFFFFEKAQPELKVPFERRLAEAFLNGTGIRVKAGGKCLKAFSGILLKIFLKDENN